MDQVHLFVALLGAVVLLSLLARPLHVPEAVVLFLGGLGLGALPFAPEVKLDADVVLLVFLPAILFPAALEFAREDVRPNVRPIGLLAIGLTLMTIATVAAAVHWALGMPWAVGFVLGAVLGPTDPVSATAILRRLGAPDRLATVLEGESLVNDAVALTAFGIAVSAVGGDFAAGSALLKLLGSGVGGAAIGVGLGWAVAEVLKRFDEVEIESAIALLTAYGAYVAAEAVGISGILATVTAGYVLGKRLPEVTSPETRLRAGSFWLLLRFVAESTLFVLVGVVFANVLGKTSGGVVELVGGVALVCVVVLATRAAWLAVGGRAAAILARGEPLLPERMVPVLTLGGLRGAVSVAVALAIPGAVGGAPFPERGTVIVIALGAVAVLLVVPALTLGRLVERLGLQAPGEQEQRELRAREEMAEAAIARAEALASDGQVSEALLERVRDVYQARLARLRDEEADTPLHPSEGEGMGYLELLQALVDAERARLHELENAREISGETLRGIERELDLSAERFS